MYVLLDQISFALEFRYGYCSLASTFIFSSFLTAIFLMYVICFFHFEGVADIKSKQEPLDLYVSGSDTQE